MTAFARNENKQSWGTALWELRSVNQRYLETIIRLPEQFRSIEAIARDKLRAKLKRGKVECFLRIEFLSHNQSNLTLNEPLVKELIRAINWIKQEKGDGEVALVDILRWPGVIAAEEQNLDEITEQLVELLDESIDMLIDVRAREGAGIKTLIEQRLDEMDKQTELIRLLVPDALAWQHNRLINRFNELNLQIDQERLEQELVILAQRLDVAEELDRLAMHIKETRDILNREEVAGRRLDFMMQELNREANTLGSKSINQQISTAVVELKVLIEQMREQIQNVE